MAVAVEVRNTREPSSRPPEPGSKRLLYLDNLKTVLVAGVIAAHATTLYVGGGEWVHYGGTGRLTLITLLGVAGVAGGLFWIGLFFLIAGLLTPASIARSGPRRFLQDRLLRLGVPFLAYVVLVMPLMHYAIYVVTYSGRQGPESLLPWLEREAWPPVAGPLWFVADLLIFSALYAGWWQLRRRPADQAGRLRPRFLVALALAIAGVSFLLHLMWPLFTHQFLDLHLSQWPQFVLLFWFGTLCAERGWLAALPDRLWQQCGWAMVAAAAAVPVLGVAGGALSGQTDLITGGWHWQALGTAAIEGVLAVCGSLWTLDLFRRWLDRQGTAAQQLTRSSYAAYVMHEPLLIGLALALRPLWLPVELNFLILAPTAVVASFAAAWLITVRLKLASQIL